MTLLLGPFSRQTATVATGLLLLLARPLSSVPEPTSPQFTSANEAGPPAVPGFPTQYAGLRTYYQSAVKELCLVAVADAPAGMGAAPMLNKNGTTYAVYLVETTDLDASHVRIKTSAGVKAIRNKT